MHQVQNDRQSPEHLGQTGHQLSWRGDASQEYKLLCPRGTQTCALAVANINVNGNGKVILDTHPESYQHQNWTCSRGSPPAPTHQIWWWSMNRFLRYLADKNSAHRQTDRQTDTRRWPQDLAAYGAQIIMLPRTVIWQSAKILQIQNVGRLLYWKSFWLYLNDLLSG